MNFALSLLGHGKGTQQTKFTEVPSIFSQRSVWMPCRRKNANLLVLIDWKAHALPKQSHEPTNFSTMLPWCLTQTCTNKAKHALLCNASSTSPTGNHEAHIASANLKKGISTNKCEVISYKLGSLMLGSLADPPPWPDKKHILRTLESPYIWYISPYTLLGG